MILWASQNIFKMIPSHRILIFLIISTSFNNFDGAKLVGKYILWLKMNDKYDICGVNQNKLSRILYKWLKQNWNHSKNNPPKIVLGLFFYTILVYTLCELHFSFENIFLFNFHGFFKEFLRDSHIRDLSYDLKKSTQ